MGFFDKIAKSLDERELKKVYKIADLIDAKEEEYKALSDEELKARTQILKQRLANGETLDDILPDAFSAVREAAGRVLGMRHFRVQMLGGIVLHQGDIAEMKTGEGKTLVSTLPAYLNALSGKGVHIITVNEYLASRDKDWMGQIFEFLGLSVGITLREQTKEEKRAAYACDITYGTNNEFGFDYLRDNMVVSKESLVQRELNYAIVDEVDSILIDEARTPLIISAPAMQSTKLYVHANAFVRTLHHEEHYVFDEKESTINLTEEGVSRAESYFNVENLTEIQNMELLHHINNALRANYLMKRDINYVVKDGEVIIVDEFTGRLMPGRRYSDGLHQAIEAKEGVRVERESQTLATITFQNYFRMYDKICGMTGTAKTEEAEFESIYKMSVYEIPTNMPMIRKDLTDIVYKSEEGKFRAVVEEIKSRHATGQPILVGTISIENSEKLSSMLKRQGIKHNVLNAKQHEKEAEIVSMAGQKDAVTISTNMAGRGTDIKLGEGVTELGGLHILGTERHESRRIDNQLRGRSGRQGDPGSSQFFISLEDDLMRLFGGDRIMNLVESVGMDDDMPIENKLLARSIETAQKKVEDKNYSIRKYVLQYDDVMNKQREVIYQQRRKVLEGESLKDTFVSMIRTIIEEQTLMHTTNVQGDDGWELDKLAEKMKYYFDVDVTIPPHTEPEEMMNIIEAKVDERYSQKEKEYGIDATRALERLIMLRVVDSKWMDHIDAMDQLKQGINLRAYGNVDPVQAYTKDGFEMFEEMNNSICEDAVRYLFTAKVEISEAQPKENPALSNMSTNMGATGGGAKKKAISKNAPCPCGSGKKYKRCCGKDL